MRYHYHNLAFIEENGKIRTGITQGEVREMSAATINATRVALGLSENAGLLSHSYLGHMTAEEYSNGKKPPTTLQKVLLALVVAVPVVLLVLVLNY